MSNLLPSGSITGPPALLAVGIAVTSVLALAAAGWISRRRTARSPHRPGSPAVKVAAIAALGCTAYSADTSWRFAADYLDMAGTVERAMMFGAAELALFATALMARQNLNIQGAPGLPGSLVWVITGVQIIPAYAESGPVGGTVRAFVGPVMAAMLWHLAMGIELRLHKPDAISKGLLSTLGREARERLLSRLGIAARDRDAAQITRDRATTRAVTLATRLADHTPQQRQTRRGRRLTWELSKALGRAAVGADPAQRGQLLDQLAARRHAHTLATIALPSPWTTTHDEPVEPASATVLSRGDLNTTVPDDGPRADTESVGDWTAGTERGPVPENAHHSAGTKNHVAGTDVGTGRGPVPGSRHHDAGTEAVEPPNSPSGTESFADETPAHTPQPHRGLKGTEPGTEATGDRGPSGTDTGTGTSSGTGRGGDRGHVGSGPARRKQKRKGNRNRSRGQSKDPSRGPALSVGQLVTRVLPHVPALLERDGNQAVTRVQLREILRNEGLRGGRNDRLGLVLQELRTRTTT
ncbi:hypothetical protein OG949_17800 [Streptomyces scopuliridis]|uniref:hypothetical protein n=1 Tax=Streptomyces scopuliridis TaxID=452529 RepID=UPI002DDBDFEE|nr:hypothetical protein [Streptomyces scopuliridis]WSB34544.1 hypothetical protein OG949_17800 [Streptomyces scopuliridis]